MRTKYTQKELERVAYQCYLYGTEKQPIDVVKTFLMGLKHEKANRAPKTLVKDNVARNDGSFSFNANRVLRFENTRNK